MNKLLIVIPFSTDNAALAERLVDWIYQLAGREQQDHCLLVCDQQVNDELRKKVKVAAEVTFLTSEMVVAQVGQIPRQIPGSFWTDLMLKTVAEHIKAGYKWPWLFLEPECAPTRATWIEEVIDAYEAQPKQYLGLHMKIGDTMFLNRVAVYSPNAADDLKIDELGANPIEINSGDTTIPKATKTRVLQYLIIESEEDVGKVRDDAAIVVGDASGILIESMREMKPRKPVKAAAMKG